MFSNWILISLVGGFINAANNITVKKIAPREDVNLLIAGGLIMAGLLLGGFYVLNQKGKLTMDMTGLGWILLMGLFVSFTFLTFARAASLGPISLVSPLFLAVINVATLVIALLLFSEKLTLAGTVGIVLTVLGAFLIAKA